MSDAPLRGRQYGTGKQPSRQPVVINKRDLVRTMDRFPTAEQLDELEPRRRASAALLTRNR